ncbi:hypothetical protein L1049_010273 [Liquidambar formosana]|uniref:WRC domain-containing protein n=1 Tax=Liquidambar formosana TaxID=63359 RepID=A0AAP0R1R0_LIQFO
MEGDEGLPDHLRCSRTDGRQWRCKKRVMDNKKLCEVHHLQGRHRQYKQKVPDSLKLQRKKRLKPLNKAPKLHNLKIRAKKVVESAKRRRSSVGVSEALDEALKKMKLKKGDLRLELIRMFLRRQVERRKKRELEAEDEGELMRDLPNGLMAISPPPARQQFGNAGPFCEVKIGIDSGSFTRRCFRSKNIEPLPIGSLQVVPFARDVANLRRRRRKSCHWCLKSSFRTLIKCSSCQKELFCMDCIEERYVNTEEVKMACPVCRGTCSCKACLENQSKDIECKEFLMDRSKVERIQHFHYMMCMLLPVLEIWNKSTMTRVLSWK